MTGNERQFNRAVALLRDAVHAGGHRNCMLQYHWQNFATCLEQAKLTDLNEIAAIRAEWRAKAPACTCWHREAEAFLADLRPWKPAAKPQRSAA